MEDDGCDLPFFKLFNKRISIIRLVGDKGFGINFIQKGICFGYVGPLPWLLIFTENWALPHFS